MWSQIPGSNGRLNIWYVCLMKSGVLCKNLSTTLAQQPALFYSRNLAWALVPPKCVLRFWMVEICNWLEPTDGPSQYIFHIMLRWLKILNLGLIGKLK